MGGDRHQQRDFIDRKAEDMANKLDNGQGQQVADMLRRDYQQLNPAQFNRLVQETRSMEQPRYGADLEIVKGTGDIIVTSRQGESYVGKMHPVVCKDTGHATKDGAVKGGLLGGVAGALIGGDRKGTLIGGVLGAGVGAIAGNESAKNDCVIVDGRQRQDRYERR